MNSPFFWKIDAFMNELHDLSCMTCYMKFFEKQSDFTQKKLFTWGSLEEMLSYVHNDVLIAFIFCLPVSLKVTVIDDAFRNIKLHALLSEV